MKRLRITIEGKTYDVDVEILEEENQAAPSRSAASKRAQAPQRAAAPAAKAPAAPKSVPSKAGDGSVASPLSGTVVSIDVAPGDSVTEGQKLITLEAMKMHTIINAPKAGTVADIMIQSGASVEEGQVLVLLS